MLGLGRGHGDRCCGVKPVGILRAMRMSGEIISLRMLAVFGSEQDGELMRQGATKAAIPGALTPVTAIAAARSVLAEGNIDIAFLDTAIAQPDKQELIAAAR